MTLDVTINIDELRAFLAELEGVDEHVEREFYSAMSASMSALEQAVVQRTPVNTGATRAGWGTEITRGAGVVKGEFANAVDYAYFVEHGRAPGRWPPIDKMVWYARRKGASGKEAENIGFLIARAIGTRGTKPGAQMLDKGWTATKGRIMSLWDAVPGKVLSRLA